MSIDARVISAFALMSVTACGTGAAPEQGGPPVGAQEAATSTPSASDTGAAPNGEDSLCLPVVHGCGCTFACGSSISREPDGSYRIVKDPVESITIGARVERWCFDERGHATPAPAAGDAGNAAGCRDVFYDGSACGGECIPTKQHLRCHQEGVGCVP